KGARSAHEPCSTRRSGSSCGRTARRRTTPRARRFRSAPSRRSWRALSASERIGVEEVRALAERILDEVERAGVGKREARELILLGLLADGHVLIEDYP